MGRTQPESSIYRGFTLSRRIIIDSNNLRYSQWDITRIEGDTEIDYFCSPSERSAKKRVDVILAVTLDQKRLPSHRP
jgi:hypothetical protein